MRVPDPTDRRAKLVLPTDRGRDVIAIAQRLVPEVENRITDLLGADRVRDARGSGHHPPDVRAIALGPAR